VIGLVVVSHSRALGEAAVGLAQQMVDEAARPRIAVAAGLDETTFGTDAVAVSEAIAEVDGPDGVLVLLDLGSAVLSAETALEFVDPETAARVVVSSAPLVEGLVAAVVLAATGAPIDAVAEEARRGLEGKQDHLGQPHGDDHPATAAAPSGRFEELATTDALTVDIPVTNPHGLHARPAARLVTLVRSFDAKVLLTNARAARGPVDASSLSKVATLNAREGDSLKAQASGPDAAAVLAAIRALADQAFGDEPPDDTTAAVTRTGARDVGGPAGRTGSGLDIAMGPAIISPVDVDTSTYVAEDIDSELRRSRDALEAGAQALAAIRDDTRAAIGEAEAEIFDAQLALLGDPSLRDAAEVSIRAGASAPKAWSTTIDALAAELGGLDDSYQRARAQDARSVRRRILAALMGQADATVAAAEESGILVVEELDAATAATLDPAGILGIVTRGGGATGHGVIVAKSRGVPIITDVGDAAADIRRGDLVAFDARVGQVLVNPTQAEQEHVAEEIAARAQRRAGALTQALLPATTADGHRIHVVANVTSVDDALVAAQQGAEGSGLVRTEILFGADTSRPTVERQAATFLSIASALGGQPITIRTWDVGGDKPLRFLPQPVEANPFLGERGLRLSRRDPEVLREQLEAICLTARETPTKVMFPMVTNLAEVEWALDQLAEAAKVATGDIPSALEVGIMVEVPAAALRAGLLAHRLDFVSIGTNDLTQYTTAAERGNAAVSGLADGLEPAVLRLIAGVCADVPERVTVALCGDLASNDTATPLLLGLGIRELSAVAPAVPSVKGAVRHTTLTAAEELARGAIAAASADDVRLLLASGA
jgi:phosphoenolpyruvate-protein phosphotransferase/dihydroxyacetone kinase phosphotransfer subunit